MAILLTDDFSRIATVSAIICAVLAIVVGEESLYSTEKFCLRVFLLFLIIVQNLGLIVFFYFNRRPRQTKETFLTDQKRHQLGTDTDPNDDLSAKLVPPRVYVFPVWLMTLFALWIITVFAITLPPIYDIWFPHPHAHGHFHHHPHHDDEHAHEPHDHHHQPDPHVSDADWKNSFFHRGHTSRFFYILNDLGNLYAFRHHVTATVVIQVYTAVIFLVVEIVGHSLYLGDKLAVAVLVISLAFSCLGILASFVLTEQSRVNVSHLVQCFQHQREAQSESRQVIEAVQCFGCATLVFEGPVSSFQETALLGEGKANHHRPSDAKQSRDVCRDRDETLREATAAPPLKPMPPAVARCTRVSRKTSECAGVAVEKLESGGLLALVEQGAGPADKAALARVCSDSLEALASELKLRCDGYGEGAGGEGEGEGSGWEGMGRGALEAGAGFRRWLFRLFASRQKGTMWSVWENTERERKREEAYGGRDVSSLSGRKTDVESGGTGGESQPRRETENPFSLFGSSVASEPIKMVSDPDRFFEVTAACRLQQRSGEVGCRSQMGSPQLFPSLEQRGGENRELPGLVETGGVCVILTFRDVTSRVREAQRAWALLENFAGMLSTAAWQAEGEGDCAPPPGPSGPLPLPTASSAHNSGRGRGSGGCVPALTSSSPSDERGGGEGEERKCVSVGGSDWREKTEGCRLSDPSGSSCGQRSENESQRSSPFSSGEQRTSSSHFCTQSDSDSGSETSGSPGDAQVEIEAETESQERDIEMGFRSQPAAADHCNTLTVSLSHPQVAPHRRAQNDRISCSHQFPNTAPARSPPAGDPLKSCGASGLRVDRQLEGGETEGASRAVRFRAVYQSKVIQALTGRKLIEGNGGGSWGDAVAGVGPHTPLHHHTTQAGGELGKEEAECEPLPLPLSVGQKIDSTSCFVPEPATALDRLQGILDGEGGGAGPARPPQHPPSVSVCQGGGGAEEGETHRQGTSVIRMKETETSPQICGGDAKRGGGGMSSVKLPPSPATGRRRIAPSCLWSVVESNVESDEEKEGERGGGSDGRLGGVIAAMEEEKRVGVGGKRERGEGDTAAPSNVPGGDSCLPPPQTNPLLSPNDGLPQHSQVTQSPPTSPDTPDTLNCLRPPARSPVASANVLWTEFVAPPYKDQVEEAIESCLRTGAPFALRLMIERPDGQLRWFECGGKRVFRSVLTGRPASFKGEKESEWSSCRVPGLTNGSDEREATGREDTHSPCTVLKESSTTEDTGTGSGGPFSSSSAAASVLGFLRDVTEEENARRRTEWLLGRSQQTLDAVFQGSIRAHFQEMVVIEASLLFGLWTGRILDDAPLTSVLRTKDAEDLRSAVFSACSSVVWFPSRVHLHTPWDRFPKTTRRGNSAVPFRPPPHAPLASPVPAQTNTLSGWGQWQAPPPSPSPCPERLLGNTPEGDGRSSSAASVHTGGISRRGVRQPPGPPSHQSHVGLLADSLAHSQAGALASVVAVIDDADPACATLNFFGLSPADVPTVPLPKRLLTGSQTSNRGGVARQGIQRSPAAAASLLVPKGKETDSNRMPTSCPPSRPPCRTGQTPLALGGAEQPRSSAGALEISDNRLRDKKGGVCFPPPQRNVAGGVSEQGEERNPRTNAKAKVPTCPPPGRAPVRGGLETVAGRCGGDENEDTQLFGVVGSPHQKNRSGREEEEEEPPVGVNVGGEPPPASHTKVDDCDSSS
uniref:Uncharacterized protein n=1 Tax=Chromera velia CCMP2878 TaxID=1169474 RepID=A0A0G4I654_9ALVE|eukprot:Cvel_11297.t1-p1 / transcript=Cvel_11297.t1 / gene=Cvel_11297 / organism=Chromera_velia_CCMP2878 / gene_product=hypothetical protein / transcript_product=hypothetical protein / location=Cvel_scaffold705:64916-71145(+) / protein_length=1710 / sequence_SO=supercontig / SO=protein_coding / is_pseudo=false